MFQVGCQDLQNNFGSFGTLGKSHKPFDTDKKMKATTKTSFLNLFGSEISIVVTATVPKDKGDYELND